MTGLNDSHKKRLLIAFEYVDRLLYDALQSLDVAEGSSPFQECIPDSLPIQRKVLSDYLARLRTLMVHILERHDISLPNPQISSLWSFGTALTTAEIAIEELKPKYMRGFGTLSDDAARDLDMLTGQLTAVLDQMRDYLARGRGPNLQTRIERLAESARKIEWIRILEEVITSHGLVELRPSLERVIERMEFPCLEVAVFGRVNSGKSSLLNYVFRTDALPVGVTPVTAIPTRVQFGLRPRATIEFAQKEPATITLQELAGYVTEQENPNNEKHVAGVRLELPADRLRKGVTFVDTPGLGSFARNGEMQSLAYLPRCDLAIVLVDAASTLVPEDGFVVDALHKAGAEIVVLMTKGDILLSEERANAARYIGDQLESNLGFEVPVRIVSVMGPDAGLCDRWCDAWLFPRLDEHQQLAEASLCRKICLLRDTTVDVLQRRRNKQSGIRENPSTEWLAAEAGLDEALAKLEAAGRERPAGCGLAERILDDAANKIVNQWREHGSSPVDATAAVVSCGTEAVDRFSSEVAKSLVQLREGLKGALYAASAGADNQHDDPDEIPLPTGMPAMDFTGGLPQVVLRRPLAGSLLKGIAFRRVRGEIDRQLGADLGLILNQHFSRLIRWRSLLLARIRQFFSAEAEFCRALHAPPQAGADSATVERDIKRLQALEDDDPPALGPETVFRSE